MILPCKSNVKKERTQYRNSTMEQEGKNVKKSSVIVVKCLWFGIVGFRKGEFRVVFEVILIILHSSWYIFI